MKLYFIALMIALTLTTPAFAEVVTELDEGNTCPPNNSVVQQTSTGTPRFQGKSFWAATVASFRRVSVNGEIISKTDDPQRIETEYQRAQDSLVSALNGMTGKIGALMYQEQVSWYNSCIEAHKRDKNYDPTQVRVDGAQAPKFIIEILSCDISSADNSDNIDVTIGDVNVNSSGDQEIVTIEYSAIIRDAKTHDKLTDCKGNVLTFKGKSSATNGDLNISVYGYTVGSNINRSRQKDNNLPLCYRTAGANLATDICRQLKNYPL